MRMCTVDSLASPAVRQSVANHPLPLDKAHLECRMGYFMPGLVLMYLGAAAEAAFRRMWLLVGYNLCAAGLTLFVALMSYRWKAA